MQKEQKEQKNRKSYSSPYRSLAMIWNVLARYSSPEKPMTVADIEARLKERRDPPSSTTVKRLLPEELDRLDTLFPGFRARAEAAGSLKDAYISEKKLHVVVETPDGVPLANGEMLAIMEPNESVAPACATIDNLLQSVADYCENDAEGTKLPVRLKCVVARTNYAGRIEYLPYSVEQDKWESGKEKSDADGDEEDRRKRRTANNRPRRYYLESVLTPAQWRILTDMIEVYPYISENQTRQMLDAIGRVFPGCIRGGRRYSFKKENTKLFHNLNVLDLAIHKRQRVSITYGEYVLNPQRKPVLRKRQNAGQLVLEPCALMWSNGYYYLVGKDRGMMNLRVDRIQEAILLDTASDHFDPPADFDAVSYRDKSPVMYPGRPEVIRFRCPAGMLGVVMDFFGEQARYRSVDADTLEVMLSVARGGVRLFAMQYADRVEVLEPEDLREDLRRSLSAALEKYAT